MRRTPLILLLPVLFLAGCVSIDQNVSVDRPSDTNPNQNPTQKCPVRLYTHRVIRCQVSPGSLVLQGPRGANDQATFDTLWSVLTVDPGQEYPMVQGSNKPMVDWNSQQVFILPVGTLESSCRRIVPARMDTDCLNVTIYYSSFLLKGDCTPMQVNPVFVYIYPKTNLPLGVLTTDDADGDGFSNDTEIKLGTDPLDPNSHP